MNLLSVIKEAIDIWPNIVNGLSSLRRGTYKRSIDNNYDRPLCKKGYFSKLKPYSKRLAVPILFNNEKCSIKWSKKLEREIENILDYYYQQSGEPRNILYVDVKVITPKKRKKERKEQLQEKQDKINLANELSNLLTLALTVKEFWSTAFPPEINGINPGDKDIKLILNWAIQHIWTSFSDESLSSGADTIPCEMYYPTNKQGPYCKFYLPSKLIMDELKKEQYLGDDDNYLRSIFGVNGAPIDLEVIQSVWKKRIAARFIKNLCLYQLETGYVKERYELDLYDYVITIG